MTTPLDDEVAAAIEQQTWRHYTCWRLDDAELLAHRLMKLAPERAWPRYLLGEIAARRLQWEEASTHFKAAIGLGRRDAETLLKAGEAAWRLNRIEEAARYMAASIATPGLDERRRARIQTLLTRLTRT